MTLHQKSGKIPHRFGILIPTNHQIADSLTNREPLPSCLGIINWVLK